MLCSNKFKLIEPLENVSRADWTNSVKKSADNQELSRQKMPINQYVVFQQMKTNGPLLNVLWMPIELTL